MTGHLDDAELDQESPIYSFSFGLSSVFVIGGPTKDERPVAIKLDSGDLLIMSGHARRCYHGVPRVLEGSFGGMYLYIICLEIHFHQNPSITPTTPTIMCLIT